LSRAATWFSLSTGSKVGRSRGRGRRERPIQRVPGCAVAGAERGPRAAAVAHTPLAAVWVLPRQGPSGARPQLAANAARCRAPHPWPTRDPPSCARAAAAVPFRWQTPPRRSRVPRAHKTPRKEGEATSIVAVLKHTRLLLNLQDDGQTHALPHRHGTLQPYFVFARLAFAFPSLAGLRQTTRGPSNRRPNGGLHVRAHHPI